MTLDFDLIEGIDLSVPAEAGDGIETCASCGAKIVEYKHHLTRPLVLGLSALARAGGGPTNIKDLNMPHNVWCNFQKLRYWDLVRRHFIGGVRKRGEWAITQKGLDFLKGNVVVQRYVWTLRGERQRYEGDPVRAMDVVEGYQLFDVWVEERRSP